MGFATAMHGFKYPLHHLLTAQGRLLLPVPGTLCSSVRQGCSLRRSLRKVPPPTGRSPSFGPQTLSAQVLWVLIFSPLESLI